MNQQKAPLRRAGLCFGDPRRPLGTAAGDPYFGQNGCTHTISDGYHLPSRPHQLILHTVPVQAPVVYFGATQLAAFFLAAKDGVEKDTAVTAIAATNTTFEIVFSMEKLPAFIAKPGRKELHNGAGATRQRGTRSGKNVGPDKA
jgi:hypothetical protein